MRINVYSQESTSDFSVVEKGGPDGATYTALMMMLHSSERLHQPPQHTGSDDDRSAVVFWLPKSEKRREEFAKSLEAMAVAVRKSKSEEPEFVENKAKELAGKQWDESSKKQNANSPTARTEFINSHWKLFEDAAKRTLVHEGRPLPGKEVIFVQSGAPNVWNDLRTQFDSLGIRKFIAELQTEVINDRAKAIADDEDGRAEGKASVLERLEEIIAPSLLPPLRDATFESQKLLTKQEKKDPRIHLVLIFLDALMKNAQEYYTSTELQTWFNNTLYLVLTGTHEERLQKINAILTPSEGS